MASWTATSPISGSKWDGPSGCPIVSPSNWQAQVLDNLTVLAGHDHSGSAGEGASIIAASLFPTLDSQFVSALFPSACAGTWSIGINTDKNSVGFNKVSTCTIGACIAYPIYIRDGVYEVSLQNISVAGTASVSYYINSDLVWQGTGATGAFACKLYSSSTHGEGIFKIVVASISGATEYAFSNFDIVRQ